MNNVQSKNFTRRLNLGNSHCQYSSQFWVAAEHVMEPEASCKLPGASQQIVCGVGLMLQEMICERNMCRCLQAGWPHQPWQPSRAQPSRVWEAVQPRQGLSPASLAAAWALPPSSGVWEQGVLMAPVARWPSASVRSLPFVLSWLPRS